MSRSTFAERSYGVAPAGYRLPDATRLGEVRLQVADLDRSVAFYRQVLGLELLARDGDTARLGAAGDREPIVTLVERRGARSRARRAQLGLYHFAVLLPDRASLGRFVAHLGRLGIRAGMSDHLVSEAVYLDDPDGLGIEVYADRPRESWSSRERQLVMATEPLDVRSLRDAAGDVEWTGAPAGTRIGHVHLHVGDLREAAAFYHDALGFDAVVWNYPGALFLSAGGYHHHLGTNSWAVGAGPATDEDARLLEWEIVLPAQADVDAAAESLDRAGHAVRRDGAAAIALDPWGTAVRLRHE